jgi:hypothetical protein
MSMSHVNGEVVSIRNGVHISIKKISLFIDEIERESVCGNLDRVILRWSGIYLTFKCGVLKMTLMMTMMEG